MKVGQNLIVSMAKSFSQFPSYVFSYAVVRATVEDEIVQQDFSTYLSSLLPIEVSSYYDNV